MMFTTLVLALPLSQALIGDASSCNSFGIDYQDGGRYFLDASRSFNFIGMQSFSGCQNDFAENILIDPSGNEKRCNRTPMQPDGAVQYVDCNGVRMYTGEWSILVLSHNGGADPILHQRDFYLSVGQEQDVSTTSPPRIGCNSMPTETLTITSVTVSYLKVDMLYDFETPSTAVAVAPKSSAALSSASKELAPAHTKSAVALYHKTAMTTRTARSIALDRTFHQEPVLLKTKSSTTAASSALTRKAASISTTIAPYKAARMAGRFRKPLSMGWRPSNYWRYALVIDQSHLPSNDKEFARHFNMPRANMLPAASTKPSHNIRAVFDPFKRF